MKRGCLTWVVIGATVYGSAASPAAASPQLSQKAGCAACHAIDQKSLGPSYQAIAQRYRGRADAPALLAERVRKGSQGVWGAVPMFLVMSIDSSGIARLIRRPTCSRVRRK